MKALDKFFNYIGFEINEEDDSSNNPEPETIKLESRYERRNKTTVPMQSTPKRGKIFDLPSNNQGMQVAIYKPKFFEDIKITADELKNGKPVIINFMELTDNSYSRMLDCLSGVLYAIDGDLIKISDYIYLASPKGVHAIGNITAESLFGGQFGGMLNR